MIPRETRSAASGVSGTGDENPQSVPEVHADPETAPWSGPGAWVFPAVAGALGAVALWGAATIEAPPNTQPPGPGLFPAIIGVLLLATAAGLVVQNTRTLRSANDGASSARVAPTEWPPVAIITGTLVVHTALLPFLGWLLAGTLLFWGVAFAFGARAYLRDGLVAVSVSAAVQVAFSLGLGLSLPGGIVEWVL